MANIYNEFIIVEEKLITDIRRSGHHINSQFTDRTAFAALKFTMEYARYDFLKIENTAASHSTNASGPLAQIVLWKWEGGTQKIEETITLNRGGTVDIDYYTSPSIIIRILEKREVIENPCSPSPDDHLTVHIGKRQVTVSASRLRSVSPMVEGMLSAEMEEKRQRTVKLNGLDITMKQFMQFLETINDHLQHGRTLPNPTNVLVLLKLADYFQIDWLKDRCEAHLINCVEIPLVERFLLIERYRLNNLKTFFMRSLNVVNLREFVKANHEQLLSSIGKELSNQLTVRLCDEQQKGDKRSKRRHKHIRVEKDESDSTSTE